MLQRVITFVLAATALGLLLLGLGWKTFFPPESYWSEAKALEYRDAFRTVHGEQDAHAQTHAVADPAQMREAWSNYERLQQELSQAQSARDRTGHLLVVGGMVCLLASIASRQFWPPADDKS
jgi:hypothetical protein